MLNKGAFDITVSIRDGLILKRENSSLQFSAAETDDLLGLIMTIMRIESYPLLPNKLNVPPFICEFHPNRSMEIRRNGVDAGVPVKFEEGDDLIWLVSQAKNQYIAQGKSTGPLKGLKGPAMPDPI